MPPNAEPELQTSTARDGLAGVFQRDSVCALLAVALTISGAFLALELWRADLRVPLVYLQDGNLNLMLIKGIFENGSYLENPRLGAPLGQELYDYPLLSGDLLNVVIFMLLGLVDDDPATVLNAFFLLTFPLVALTAFVAMRLLGTSPWAALVCSTLYALAPYHFFRGEHHVLLSAYYAVPLASYLVVALLVGEPLFSRRQVSGRRWLAFVSRTTLITIAMCVVIASASGSFYYSAFAVILIAIATLLRFVVGGSVRAVAVGGAVIAVIVGLSAVFLTPTFAHQLEHGPNEARTRSSYESEYYSLRLTQLVLPVRDHRVHGLANGTRAYENWSGGTGIPTTEAAFVSLGVIGSLGFLTLLGVTLASAVAGTRRRLPPVLCASGVATVAAFLIATMGGFSSLLGFVSPQLRAWNRLSIFIAFFSLLAVALVFDRMGRRVTARFRRPLLVGTLAALLLVGFFDQTTRAFVPAYETTSVQYASDRTFAREIERRLPGGASVFQLPYASFPESSPLPPGRTLVYDMVRPYLHTEQLRWSFGAMQGRPQDWASRLANEPPGDVLPVVSALGFTAVYVDRLGYDDDTAADAAEADLVQTIGERPLRSPDGRILVFDLQPYTERLDASLSAAELARLRERALIGR